MQLNNGMRVAALLGLVMQGAAAVAQNYEVTRSTIGGGGVIGATGGNFELSGTIGQPDAGTLTGGTFELSGGFWFPVVTGDFNEDGVVDSADFASFPGCLAGPDLTPTGAGCTANDLDGDGDADLTDFGIFQNAISGQ